MHGEIGVLLKVESMSLRFRTIADIAKLSDAAKQQIKTKAPHSIKKHVKATRVKKTHDGYSFCPYPSYDPGVKLHTALVKAFGSVHLKRNGEIAHEVVIAGSSRAFRYDHLHVPSRTFIEFDGWRNHSTLSSFKADRTKEKQGLLHGFIVVRVTNEEVRKNIDSLIDDIKRIIAYRGQWHDRIEPLGKTYHQVIKVE